MVGAPEAVVATMDTGQAGKLEKELAYQPPENSLEILKKGSARMDNKHIPVKTRPYKHQYTAFRIGRTLDQSALIMEQGTGKTLSAIATAGHRYNKGQIKKLLIVCPLSVVPVWHEEFQKHADFDYSIGDLTRVKDKKIALTISPKKGLWIGLINYESSWRILDLLTKWNPDMIIIDESQRIKNGRAKQSKGLHKLGDITKYKMILTGTPVTQGPLDMWSQYRFLNPDIFGRKFTSFRNRYAIMEGLRGRPEIRLVVGYKNLDELAEKAHMIAYRVTKEEALDLPPTVDQTVMVKLSSEAHKIYKQMEKDFMVTFSDEKISTAPIILTQLLRLQQITGGFLHTEDKTVEKFDSSKLAAVKELLSDLPSDKKVVIFARFSPEIEALEEISKSLDKRTLTLQGGTKNRGEVIKSFQEDPEVKVIVIQIQTGGLGITLTAADTAIFYSTTFSFADYEQAKARLHRIGQHHPVNYIHMIAEDTIDEDILAILRSKGDMATQIIDTMREKRFSKIAQKTMDKSSKVVYDKNMDTKTTRKEELYQEKEVHNVTKKEELLNMIGLDQKAKGGWYYSETTKSILRKESDGETYILQKGVETLEAAKIIIADLNKSKEGDQNIMAKNKDKKLSKKEKKAQKAAQVIEEVAEEVEEEIEEIEEVEAEETPKKESKKAKRARIAQEKAEAAKPAKKSEKAKAEKPAKAAPATGEIDPNAVGVKELAGMVNMDPKALRKSLREMFPEHEAKTQWVWKRDSKALNSLVKKLNK